MVSAWNLVCGRFINFKKVRKKLTLLTFGCPSDIGLWHCLIHTLELAVGNALELPLTQLTYGHFLKVYIHHIASHRRSCENLVTVPTICISVSKELESCLVSLGDFIFQSCVRSLLGIVFPSEENCQKFCANGGCLERIKKFVRNTTKPRYHTVKAQNVLTVYIKRIESLIVSSAWFLSASWRR